MTVRLYLDEDSQDQDLLAALRARGVNVTCAAEVGMNNRSDREQLAYATLHGRVLYTFNVGDFCRQHKAYAVGGLSHGGIIVARQQQYSIGEQMRRLLRIIAARSADKMQDRLEFLSTWG